MRKTMFIPKLLYYTENHLWLRQVGEYEYFLGITDFAQKQIGSIATVYLKSSDNSIFEKKTPVGNIHGASQDFTIIAPFSGKIIAINSDLNKYACKINGTPYLHWLLRVTADKAFPLSAFLNSEDYRHLTNGF